MLALVGHVAQIERLTSSREIRAVMGRRLSAGSVIVVVHGRLRDPELASPDRAVMPTRVAVVAGRRVGNAVRRNRAKRRIRAALHDAMQGYAMQGYAMQGSSSLPTGLDLVITAKAAAVDVPYDQLFADVRRTVGRVAARAAAA